MTEETTTRTRRARRTANADAPAKPRRARATKAAATGKPTATTTHAPRVASMPRARKRDRIRAAVETRTFGVTAISTIAALAAGALGYFGVRHIDEKRRAADPAAKPVLREAADRVSETASAATERASEMAGTAGEAIRHAAHEAGERVSEGIETMRDGTMRVAGSLKDALHSDDRAADAMIHDAGRVGDRPNGQHATH